MQKGIEDFTMTAFVLLSKLETPNRFVALSAFKSFSCLGYLGRCLLKLGGRQEVDFWVCAVHLGRELQGLALAVSKNQT